VNECKALLKYIERDKLIAQKKPCAIAKLSATNSTWNGLCGY